MFSYLIPCWSDIQVCRVGECGLSKRSLDSTLLGLISHQNKKAYVARNGASIIQDADRNGDGVLDVDEAAEYLILNGKMNKQVRLG